MIKRTLYIVCFFWLFSISPVLAQQAIGKKDRLKLEKADQLVKDQLLTEAIEIYEDVLARNHDNAAIQLALASIYLKLHNSEEALRWYAGVLDRSTFQLPVAYDPVHIYQYAELLQGEDKQEDALYWYRIYQGIRPDDTRSARKMEGIRTIPNWKRDADKFKIKEVSFNSRFADFSPSFYEDGLVFVSGREESGKSNAGAEYLDLYYCMLSGEEAVGEIQKMDARINTSLHEGPAVFYDQYQKMIFTRNDATIKRNRNEEKVVVHLQLYYTEKIAGTPEWKQPTLLPMNDPGYSVAHPAINEAGTLLYMASDMPGGYGNTDLYVCEWQNGKWGAPKNLGSDINTEGDEMFPFLLGDTLYFASTGHPGLGGLDIYKAAMGSVDVINVGYPINSVRDDFGFILRPDAQTGYFSSDRKRSETGQHSDIYRVEMQAAPPVEKEEPLVYEEPEAEPLPDIYYTIQILALKETELVGKWFMKDLQGVLIHDGKDGFHRYTYGTFSTLEGALNALEGIRAKGYSDAFIRQEERYKDLSLRPGVMVDTLYR